MLLFMKYRFSPLFAGVTLLMNIQLKIPSLKYAKRAVLKLTSNQNREKRGTPVVISNIKVFKNFAVNLFTLS